jgi:hypothetical protein
MPEASVQEDGDVLSKYKVWRTGKWLPPAPRDASMPPSSNTFTANRIER